MMYERNHLFANCEHILVITKSLIYFPQYLDNTFQLFIYFETVFFGDLESKAAQLLLIAPKAINKIYLTVNTKEHEGFFFLISKNNIFNTNRVIV